ncbi:unnamed protein product [Caenorhabditis sp. 36 PRJEB53466]|nr:unnamed protein product [Caenorhabditis sp. 36 PRJEB53466]
MEETNAFSALNQLAIPQNMVSPMKSMPLLDEKVMEILMNIQQQTGGQLIPQQHLPVACETTHESAESTLKASPSASSEISETDVAEQPALQNYSQNPLQQVTIDSQANIAAGTPTNAEQRSSNRYDTWMECYTTTKLAEYEALLFSVFVTERTDRKFDGWTYFDCLHRLQSKCRYRVRAKKQDEFYIVEEKCVHNHGAVEPVGQPGSHAGLPKTIRELVDRSYRDGWPVELRTAKVDEEIKRLGLPANPRLGRQIDNRIAYLRRVRNLNESRRMQDQMAAVVSQDPLQLQQEPGLGSIPFDGNSMVPDVSNVLQALMNQNGGSVRLEKDVVEQLMGPQFTDALAAAQQGIEQTSQVENIPMDSQNAALNDIDRQREVILRQIAELEAQGISLPQFSQVGLQQ